MKTKSIFSAWPGNTQEVRQKSMHAAVKCHCKWRGRGMHDVEWVLAAGLVLYIGLYTKNIKYVTKYLSVIYAFWICYNRPYVLLFEPIFPYNIYFSREVLAGRTGPPRGPHAARGPQVGHPWSKLSWAFMINTNIDCYEWYSRTSLPRWSLERSIFPRLVLLHHEGKQSIFVL